MIARDRISKLSSNLVLLAIGVLFVLPLLWVLFASINRTAGLRVEFPTHPSLENFRAVLNGGNEIPPRETLARGVATVRFSSEGTKLGFRLVVANIENVFAAHIHCGVAGDVWIGERPSETDSLPIRKTRSRLCGSHHLALATTTSHE